MIWCSGTVKAGSPGGRALRSPWLNEAIGVKEWTIHDLRRTAATRMADSGVQPHIIEAVLNHVSGHKGGIAGVYNRAAYEPEKREALDTLATLHPHSYCQGYRSERHKTRNRSRRKAQDSFSSSGGFTAPVSIWTHQWASLGF